MQIWIERLQQVYPATREFIRRNWERLLEIRERLRWNEETFHLLLAGGVGVIGGLTNLIFYTCIDLVQQVVFGKPGDLVEMAEVLEWWQRLAIPALGGLAAGLVLYWGGRFIGQQGSSNMLEVIVAGNGRLPFRTAIVKAVSSLISIGTGSSIGREGAMTHLAATFASKWGQLLKWQPYRLRLLVACGAASGIAAAYNAPVAGAVFAAQIVMGNFSMSLFAPLVFSSVIATIVSRNFFGINPWHSVPAFDFTRMSQLPWFLLLGFLAGFLGAGFMKLLRRSEHFFEGLKIPLYSRLALGGLIVGIIAVGHPQVWGNGYSVANRILDNHYTFEFLLVLLVAKMVATLVTVGSGTVGGVFTPTLFLGAGLGSLFGMGLHYMNCATELPTGAFALAGMGSVLSATTGSPLLAMIMVFEISLNYSLMPALMLSGVISTLIARRLHPESIYTEPLRQKGVSIDEESSRTGAATEHTVGDVMKEPVTPVRENTTLEQLTNRFLTTTNNFLPVVDAQQRFIGVVALQDLKEHLNTSNEYAPIIAMDVMRPPPPCLTPNQRLLDALPILLASEQRKVAVVNTRLEMKLVGSIARAETLGMLSEAIAAQRNP